MISTLANIEIASNSLSKAFLRWGLIKFIKIREDYLYFSMGKLKTLLAQIPKYLRTMNSNNRKKYH